MELYTVRLRLNPYSQKWHHFIYLERNCTPFLHLERNCTPFLYLKDKPKQNKFLLSPHFFRSLNLSGSNVQRLHAFICFALLRLPQFDILSYTKL